MDLAPFELREPRLDVPAKERDLQVGPHAPDLRLPAQRRGADDPALGQFPDAGVVAADEGVPHILAREVTRDHDAVRKGGRQILGGMYADIDGAIEKRDVELLGEQPLAARLREGAILDRVAGRLDRQQRQARSLPAMGDHQAALGFVRLGKGERASPRADDQGGWIGHSERVLR